MADVTPIAHLINECRDSFRREHGVDLTYAAIARRSGGKLTRQRVQQYATEPVRNMPGPDTTAALASGLGVSEGLVLQRLLETTGHAIPEQFPVAARRGTPLRRQAPGADEGA